MSRLERFLRRVLRFSTAGPALTRYYICPRVKLHRIHADDEGYHNHPWNGISIIFGSYWEAFEDEAREGGAARVWHKRRFFNRVSSTRKHKVYLAGWPVWTLFIHGARTNESWAYGGRVKPWEGSDQERSAS